MFVNHSLKQVTAKIVYYGPGLSGKTTNLQYIFSVTNPKSRGELVSIETEIERTLFFDLLPLNVGVVKDYQTKLQLYTVPGQIFYDSTRKLVLKGADGIVFVVDSQALREQAGLESFENLKSNLSAYNIQLGELPLVYQFNKRDLDSISPINRLKKVFNIVDAPYFEAVATDGIGVIETLKEISSLTLKKVIKLIDKINYESVNSGPINFDTNTEQEIKKFEELPVKKIPMEEIDSFSEKMNEGQEEINTNGRKTVENGDAAANDPANEYKTIVLDNPVINPPDDDDDDDDDEIFTLDEEVMVDTEEEQGTRIFSKSEFEAQRELVEKSKQADDKDLPFGNLPEEDIVDDNILNLGEENIVPVEEKAAPNISPPPTPKDEYATIVKSPETEFPFENLPEQDLDDLTSIGEPEEVIEAGPQEVENVDSFSDIGESAEPFQTPDQDLDNFANTGESDEPFQTPDQDLDNFDNTGESDEPFQTPDQELDNVANTGESDEPFQTPGQELDNVANMGEPGAAFPPGDKDLEFDLHNTNVQDVLKQFEDQSRIAVIRKVSLQAPQLFIDVKDRNGTILEKVELYVNPDIKKVTLILDVQK